MSIAEVNHLAEAKGGRCLSQDVFIKTKDRVPWACRQGHTWESTLGDVKYGKGWCLRCAGHARYTIKDMQKLALERSGLCLSATYNRAPDALLWQCNAGHEWSTSAHSVLNGHWCPYCNLKGGSEEACRELFELHFQGYRFAKARPSWLVNSRGFRMELDGYCSQLPLAFEYQGRQHYKRQKSWHTQEQFNWYRQRDREKVELCKQNNVSLVVIPYDAESLAQMIGDAVIEWKLETGHPL